MATLRYADFAAEQLRLYMSEALPGFITEVNTDQPTETALLQMQEFVGALHPFSVELLPRLEIEFQSIDQAEPAGQKNDIWDVELGIIIVTGFKDGDVIEGQKELRRYLSAIFRTIQDDITLETANGAKVIECEILSGSASGAVSDIGRLYGDQTTLVRVQIQEP